MNEPRIAFELEVERRSRRAPNWYTLATMLDAELKYDDSLTDGREFASLVPRTLDAWRTLDLTDTFKLLAEDTAGDRTTTAGLHLHVDRKSFSGAGLARLFTIVNHPDSVLYRLSRRRDTTYCSFRPHVSSDMWERRAVDGLRPVYDRECDHNKYAAVYCHEEYPTVELRFFRSTVRPDRFYAALETAHALWQYSEQFQTRPATGRDWAAWVRKHPNYAILAKELQTRRAVTA